MPYYKKCWTPFELLGIKLLKDTHGRYWLRAWNLLHKPLTIKIPLPTRPKK